MNMERQKNRTCCFFGHRKITVTEKLKNELEETVENLIVKENVGTFLFGSRSCFDDLCHKTVTNLKRKYMHIKRIYVRAEYPYIDENYRSYLLESYEDTYYPERIVNAGKAVYVERNFEIIDKSDVCVFYYDENYLPSRRKNRKRDLADYQPKSGTKIAYEYAKRGCKKVVLLNP